MSASHGLSLRAVVPLPIKLTLTALMHFGLCLYLCGRLHFLFNAECVAIVTECVTHK